MKPSCAILVDVVDSRHIRDFADQRDWLVNGLSRRHRQRGWISIDYAVTAWDEFQGLIERPESLPWVLWDLWLHTYPMKLRIGLGGGDVEWHGGRERALNESVTGEAFFLAREALDFAHGRHRASALSGVVLRWNNEVIESAGNGMLRLIDGLVDRLSETQWRVIREYERLHKQVDVALALAKSESTISRSLASAQYWQIRASLEDLERVLLGLLHGPAADREEKGTAC